MGSRHIFLRIRKIKAISSFCSMRCAFCFPMAASCCLLLSLLCHCLDSLRPPQEGKVDIYVEPFGLTISRRSIFPDLGSLPLIQSFLQSTLGKKMYRLRQWLLDLTGDDFSCVFQKCRQAASLKAPLTHTFQRTPPMFLFFRLIWKDVPYSFSLCVCYSDS